MFKNSLRISLVILLSLVLGTVCFGSIRNHETLPYKMYIINRYLPGGLILLSAKVNLQSKKLDLEFNSAGLKRLAEIKVAEIIEDCTDINLLGTFNVDCNELKQKQKYQQIQLSIPKVKKGMSLVVWIDKVKINGNEIITTIQKQHLLDSIKTISLEQERLSLIGIYKGKDELVNEVGRNCEE